MKRKGAKFVASTIGLALAFTGLTVATTAAPALAFDAAAFSCTTPTFFAQAGDATTTQLYTGTFATATGQSTWTPLGALNNTTANNYNAMALNPVNHYLYGVVISGAIVKIDNTGTTTTVGQTTPTALGAAPSTLWDTGAFDPSGNYYVADGNAGTTTINKITGLDTGSAVRSTITLPASITFADLTWKDGYLWGHSYGTGSGTNFYRIDVSTPTASVVTINSAIIPAAAYGAAYTITNGNLSFISNSTMYQVAVANPTSAAPTVSLVNSVTAPTNARSDASNCLGVQNADLKITKTGPANVAVGATINWTVTVHNNGPGTSSGWVVKDTLPANVTAPTATSSNATCVINAPTITCSGGTLASGSDAVINVSATAPNASTVVTNSASIEGYEIDPTAANSTASVSTNVGSQPLTLANDAASTPYITATNVNVTSNDTFTGGGVTAVSTPTNGTTSINADGTIKYTPKANFSGTDTFTYTVTDGTGQTGTATVTMTVSPLAVDDSTTTNANTAIDIPVTANDKGVSLTLGSVTAGANTHGTVTVNGNAAHYVPTTGFSGTATFTYVLNGAGGTSNATVTVLVKPTAADDALTTSAETAVTDTNWATNDAGTSLTVTAKTNGTNGTVSIASGAPVYTPNTGFSGNDSFTYTVTDASGQTATATVTVTVTPKANGDSITTPAETAVTVPVLTNDKGTTLTVTAKTDGSHGTVSISGGTPIYTPAAGYSGPDTFTYTITDGTGRTSTATVAVTITPVAKNDAATTEVGDPVSVPVRGNDLGTTLTVTAKTDGSHGTVSIASGTPVYTPAAGYTGSDTFTYTVTDASGQTSTATVAISVTPGPTAANDTATTPAKTAVPIDVLGNDTGTGLTLTGTTDGSNGTVAIVGGKAVYTPTGSFSGTDTFTYTGKDAANHPISATVTVTITPVAVNDTATVTNGGSISINVRSNDSGSALTVTGKTNGSNGTVVITGGSPVYSSTGDFSGTDTFTYTVKDSSNQTATATVTVTVTPRAGDDAVTTPVDVPVTVDSLTNDHGTSLTVTGTTNGAHGTVVITGGKPVYTPASGYSGADAFTYTVTDGTGQTATAIVTVTVTPKAIDDTATTVAGDAVTINVKTNDKGTGLVVSSATNGAHGTVSIATGTPVYTPAAGFSGTDAFTYTVSDGTSTSTATVTVTVTPGPAGVDDSAATDAGVAVTINVLANDSGTSLTLTGKTNGSNGTVAIVSGKVVYTPAAGFSGVDTFTYTGKDATNHSISATVTVTVDPKAVNDTTAVTAGGSVSVPVLVNDLGTTLSVTDASDGAHGTVSLSSGSPVYTANGNYSGSDSFTYEITDGTGNTSNATVSVTVNPKAVADTATTPAGTDVTVPVLANDLGSSLAVTGTTNGTHGTVTVVGGMPVYSPATNYSGGDTFTYTITDGAAHPSTATVTVTVTPKAVNDAATTVAGDPIAVNVKANDLGSGLTVTGSTAGAHGTVSIATGSPVYTPAAGFSGTDTFTYTVTDSNGKTDTATVTVTVTPGPSGVDDTATTPAKTAVTIDVLANDIGTALTLTGKTNGSNGTVTVDAGQLVYTPTGNFSGEDTFTYTGQDSTGHAITATVTVTVLPVAKDDVASVASGSAVTVTVLTNDLGTGLTVTDTTDGAHGAVAIVGGKPVYTSDNSGFSGIDTFTYEVTDGNGKKSSATVAVTVAPKAVADTATTDATAPVTVDVLANDLGSALDVQSVTDGTHGTVSIIGGEPVYTPTGSFSGTDTFTYTLVDGNGTTSTATVTVTVNPLANDDSAGVVSGETVTVPVLGNDIGAGLTVTDTTDGAHGTVTIVAGKPVYSSDAGFTGTDTFTYTVTDASGDTATATVTVMVASGPMAIDDAASTDAGTPVTIDVLSNDIGTGLTLTGKTNGSNGTVSIVAGKVVFTPAAGFSGVDTFTYTGKDAGGDPISATVTVTVEPNAKNDTATVSSGGSVTVPVLANDLGADLAITGVSDGTHGTVSDTTGTPVYTADPTFSGTDTFTYTVTDGTGNSSTATVTVTVKPKANPDAQTTPANAAVSIDVLANDAGSALTITDQNDGLHGSVALVSGTLVYTPNNNYSGPDSFTYQVTDSHGTTSSTTVTITVTPTAGDDTASTNANTPVTVTVVTNDHGRTLVVSHDSDGAHGTVTIVGGKPVYTPNAGFSGTDSFTYLVTDASGQTAVATVTVTVAPGAVADTVTTVADQPVNVDVADNDAGTGLTVSGTSDGLHGTVDIQPDGTVTYTPDAGYSGTDTFTYTVTDGTTTSTATVTVTVKPSAVNDARTTPSGTAVTLPPMTNDDGSSITVTAKTNGAHGSVAIQASGTNVVYTPVAGFSGTDTFTYTITDSHGQTATATVTITVTPVAVDDSKTTGVNVPVTINAITNDLGTGVTITDAGNGSHGTVTIVSGKLVYTPDNDYSGTDSFVYTITDGTGQTTTATVYILVTPLAPDDAATTPTGTPITVDVLANDVGTGLTVTSVTQPSHGTVTIVGNEVHYVPAPGFSGEDTFTYTSTDSNGKIAVGTVTIFVTPVAANNTATATSGSSVTLDPSGNDTGSGLATTAVGTPSSGSVVLNPDGTITFTPTPGFSGTVTIPYTTTDTTGQTATAIITITIKPAAKKDRGHTTPSKPITTPVLGNDSGSGLTITGHTNPSHGSVVVNANGTITYTPKAGFSGTDTYTYTITDSSGQSVTTTVTIVVDPPLGTTGLGTNGLAFTGSDPTTALTLAGLLLVLGGLVLGFALRRRRPAGRHLAP